METNGSQAPKPIVYLNKTKEAVRARELLDRYDIDFEECETDAPYISLQWNGVRYTDLWGVLDFLMFAGRLPIVGIRRAGHRSDGKSPGSPVPVNLAR